MAFDPGASFWGVREGKSVGYYTKEVLLDIYPKMDPRIKGYLERNRYVCSSINPTPRRRHPRLLSLEWLLFMGLI